VAGALVVRGCGWQPEAVSANALVQTWCAACQSASESVIEVPGFDRLFSTLDQLVHIGMARSSTGTRRTSITSSMPCAKRDCRI